MHSKTPWEICHTSISERDSEAHAKVPFAVASVPDPLAFKRQLIFTLNQIKSRLLV